MYYEEKEIDGILYFRTIPNGVFTKMSERNLCDKINKLRLRLSRLSEKFEDLQSDYNDLLNERI